MPRIRSRAKSPKKLIVRLKNDRTAIEMVKDARRLYSALKWLFEFQHWRIDITENSTPGIGPPGACRTQVRYFTATIELDWVQLRNSSEDEFWETLLHEFAHVFLSEYDKLDEAAKQLALSDRERDLLHCIYRDADERMVQRTILGWLRSSPTNVRTLTDFARHSIERYEGRGQ